MTLNQLNDIGKVIFEVLQVRREGLDENCFILSIIHNISEVVNDCMGRIF
jgi:hypothetical protein